MDSTAGDSRIAVRPTQRVPMPWVAGGTAVLRGQQRLGHRGQAIRGAAWALLRDALLELRFWVRGHRGVAVRADNLRG